MKITDSPGAILVMPFKDTATLKDFESSSIFQPAMFAVALPMFFTSNQSPRRLVGPDAGPPLPLDHGATSEIMSVAVPPVEAVTVMLKFADASGEMPTAGSSTFTVTVKL